MGNPAAHARAMQAKTSEALEVLAAVVVTAGLVAGNLVLFSPLRVDNRVQPAPVLQTAERPEHLNTPLQSPGAGFTKQ